MQRIALPISGGNLSEQMEHCSQFALYDIRNRKISCEYMDIPAYIKADELPVWLAETGVTDIVIYKADKQTIDKLIKNKINLFIGIKPGNPIEIINDFIEGHLYSDDKIIKEITA